ncbi:hypothetical protein LOK49_LG02G01349 [Camellia lanceoleosa]|uniref:Uncharacterized protein n=1 Tax=Camellia lanceoleosa TaxID=1840588 RepID=A0ACC0ITX1_9ERIC|nr:hypothetical protein LOK49_LG02G01349 [Camellia lanceoleosa]
MDLPFFQSEESEFIDSPHKVYVSNLAKTVTTELLKNFLLRKGRFLVQRYPSSGTSKSSGFGFVTFSSEEDVSCNLIRKTMLLDLMYELSVIKSWASTTMREQ